MGKSKPIFPLDREIARLVVLVSSIVATITIVVVGVIWIVPQLENITSYLPRLPQSESFTCTGGGPDLNNITIRCVAD